MRAPLSYALTGFTISSSFLTGRRDTLTTVGAAHEAEVGNEDVMSTQIGAGFEVLVCPERAVPRRDAQAVIRTITPGVPLNQARDRQASPVRGSSPSGVGAASACPRDSSGWSSNSA